jgi:hypothetical protein
MLNDFTKNLGVYIETADGLEPDISVTPLEATPTS